MDFLTPILGSVTGIETAHWKDILIFAAKVILFAVPFAAMGYLLERDVIRVPAVHRVLKSAILMIFTVPFILFGILNFFAPRLPDAFWEKYPVLVSMWIMEGTWPPLVFMGVIVLFVLLYLIEVLGGDLTK